MDRKTELDDEAARRGLTAREFVETAEKRRQPPPLRPLSGEEELTRDLVRAFVSRPEYVEVTSQGDGARDSVTVLTLTVHDDDYGATYGKMGRKLQSLRTVVQLLGARDRREFRLVFPEIPRRPEEDMTPPLPFVPQPDWVPDDTVALLKRVLDRLLAKPYSVLVIRATKQINLEVSPAEAERAWALRVQPYINTVFHAIGKSQGQELYVEVKEVSL